MYCGSHAVSVTNPPTKLSTNTQSTNPQSPNKKFLPIVLGIAGGIMLLILVLLFALKLRPRKGGRRRR